MIAVTAPVLLVGCGKMGGALLKGWLDGGLKRGDVAVIEPDAGQRNQIQDKFGIAAYATAGEIPPGFQPAAVVIAVKPQVMAEALPAYAGFSKKGAVFLSIAAGKKIAALRALLGGGAVVRAMPNLPAAVGRGITVACAGPDVPAAARVQCEHLLSAVGGVAWIGDEALMDAVTAVSGSGRLCLPC
jgi:pyrroline-5-carboxylate reductase